MLDRFPNSKRGRKSNLPTSRHGGAGVLVADRQSCKAIDLLDNLEHAMEQAILFNDCVE